jgi:DNA-binding transcriptional LysR family regulator
VFPGLIRTFHEVVRSGSIRRAGDSLGVSPSSISRQVAVLERQMGTKLFERTATGIRLTYAGEMVAAYSRDVVANFDSLKADLDDLRGRKRREIRIAVVESIVASIAITVIASFRRTYEQIYFKLTMMPATAVIEAVRSDACDLGITMSPSADPDIRSLAKSPEPVVAVVREDDLLAGENRIGVDQICQRAVALPDQDFVVRRMFDAAIYQRNLTVLPSLVSNSFEALRNHVRQSGEIAILPLRAATDPLSPRLCYIPIDDEALRQGEVHVIAHRGRKLPAITNTFINEMLIAIERYDATLPDAFS